MTSYWESEVMWVSTHIDKDLVDTFEEEGERVVALFWELYITWRETNDGSTYDYDLLMTAMNDFLDPWRERVNIPVRRRS